MEELEMIASGAVQDQVDKQADEALIKDLNARNEAEGTFGIPITRSPFQTPGEPGYDREKLGGSAVSAKTFRRQGYVPPVANTAAAAALVRGPTASFFHGLMAPIASLMPSWYESLGQTAEADRATMEKFIQQPSYGVAGFSPAEAKAGSYAPQVLAELAGTAIPGVGSVKAANAIWRVGAATKSIGRIVGAGATAGGMFSIAAEADSGEDRVYNVMLNAGGGAVLDAAVVLGTTHRALRTEIREGKKKLDQVVEEIASKTGQHTDNVESKMGSIRNGSSTKDVETAEQVLKATQGTPAEKTPLAHQSAKIVEAFNMRSPNFWTVQAGVERGSGVTIKTRINGIEEETLFKSDATGADKNLFRNTVFSWGQKMESARLMGHKVEILEATYGASDKGAASWMLNLLENGPGAKRTIQGAPAPGTVAHSGNVPQVGATVTVRVPGGGTVTGTVLEVGASASGGPGRAAVEGMEPGSTRVYGKNGKWIVQQSTGVEEEFATAKEATTRANALYVQNTPEVQAAKARMEESMAADKAMVEGKAAEVQAPGVTVTRDVRQQLYDLGYSKAHVDELRPEHAVQFAREGKGPIRLPSGKVSRSEVTAEGSKPADVTISEDCHSPCKWTVRTKNNEVLEEFEDSKSAQAYAKSIIGKGEYVAVVRPDTAPVKQAAAATQVPVQDISGSALGIPAKKGTMLTEVPASEFIVDRSATDKKTWVVRKKDGTTLKKFKDSDQALLYAENLGQGKPVTLVTPEQTKVVQGTGERRREYLWNRAGERVDAEGNVMGRKRPARPTPGEGPSGPEFADTPETMYRSKLMSGEEPDLPTRVQGREMVPRSRSYEAEAVPQELVPYVSQDQWSRLDYSRRMTLASQHGTPELVEELRDEFKAYSADIAARQAAGQSVSRRVSELTTPPPEPMPEALRQMQLQAGYIRLEVGGKEIVAPFTDVNALIPTQGPVLNLRAHRSGKERRFTVDLGTGDVTPEPLDAPGGYWREPEFTSADPSSDYEHELVRGFSHRDDTLTLSVTPVVIQETESQTGLRANIGRLDRAQPVAPSEFGAYRQSFGGKAAAGDLAPSGPEGYWDNRFTAGFEPRRQQLVVRTAEGEIDRTKTSGITNRSIVYDENVALEDLDPTARRKVQKIHDPRGLPDKTQRPDVKYKDPATGRWTLGDPTQRVSTLRSYEIFDKTQGTNPNMVQFRDAARKLIKAGVPESTPVRLRVSHTTHAPGKQKPSMTLREAADIDLGYVSPGELEKQASLRGYSVKRDPKLGTWTVENALAGEKQVFHHPMEAMAAISKIPIKKSGVKLEGELERTWNMGRERGRDPDVDSKAFLPAQAVDQAFQEVVSAGRPGMEMYVVPHAEIGGVQQAGGKGLTEAALRVMSPPNRVQAILDNLAEKVPQMRSLRTWTAPELVNGRQKMFVYDENKVQQIFKQWEQGFQKLGVEVRDANGMPRPTHVILSDIDRKIPDGLDILKGRDPSDAFMYSWYKSKSMKEEFMAGKLQADSQGQYRMFPPEEKNAAFAKLPPC